MCERAVKRRYICAVWLRRLTENHYDFLHYFLNFIICLCKRCVAHVVSVTARHGLMLRERWWKFWWCYWCLLCRSLGEGKLELVFTFLPMCIQLTVRVRHSNTHSKTSQLSNTLC